MVSGSPRSFTKRSLMINVNELHMPRYNELPNMGLYLEQVVRYINGVLATFGCQEITASMVSNYVKKGYIDSPVKKQYYADQIAYLFFISIAKMVLSMENIHRLLMMQQRTYTIQRGYDYFCRELEGVLRYIFGIADSLPEIENDSGEEKKILRSATTAMSHIIYLRYCFETMDED